MKRYAKIKLLALLSGFLFHANCLAQTGKVKSNGIEISYESLGSEKMQTILLISGTGAQLTMWPDEFCKKLSSKGYRVIRFDNRDVGLSTKFDSAGLPNWEAIGKALSQKQQPPLAYTLDDMAKDAVGLLDALKIKKAHIVGASMGGMIAQRLAYNHPDHVLSLVSIMAGGGNATFPLVAKPDAIKEIPEIAPNSDKETFMQREIKSRSVLAGNTFKPDQNLLRTQVQKDFDRSFYPPGFYRQGAASTVGFYAGRQAELKAIKVPTLVIHGSEDPLVTVDAGKDVANLIPNASFVLLDGMGHDLPQKLFDNIIDLIAENAERAK
ncbi:alpha/beta hydrolase [Flavobacterium sp.]|uniref:alpha/beta fold hydrolase n=1 Tax=Flavobacterium sp. TaxID=239 RepID=UPI001223768C|nr:alpha/beta hydrolase [Flavobacterium sp.]RZJ73837.1 MAG: alpha/beta hydrolase [Flavobacterium sp.]